MNRKLMVLNILLSAAVIYAGFQFRRQWKVSQDLKAKAAPRPVKTLPPMKYSPVLPEAPVLPSSYANVAQQTLFDPSRNPNVPVEEPPPPPPPPPMPPLPAYHGLMNIGTGPMAFLSIGTGRNQATRLGESIGPFKLLDVTSDEVVFEWEGKPVRQSLSRPKLDVADSGNSGRTEAPPMPSAPAKPALVGPGEQTQFGQRICNMNDGYAEGTVVDGFRKVIYRGPFGQSCGWEK